MDGHNGFAIHVEFLDIGNYGRTRVLFDFVQPSLCGFGTKRNADYVCRIINANQDRAALMVRKGAGRFDHPSVKGGLKLQRVGFANGIAEHLPSDISR